jgi:hypothetical protein
MDIDDMKRAVAFLATILWLVFGGFFGAMLAIFCGSLFGYVFGGLWVVAAPFFYWAYRGLLDR